MSASNIVLITGAKRGIGYGVARKLAREYPDYLVIIGSRDAKKGQEAASALISEGLTSIASVEIDVTSDDIIAAAEADTAAKYQRLDVLYSIREMMQRTYEVSLFGAAAVTQAFIPLLEKSENPRIVITSSSAGSLKRASDLTNPWAKAPIPEYRTNKAALNMLMVYYANILQDKGFKVNSSYSGHVARDLNSHHGTMTVGEGAANLVRLATLGNDGASGTFTTSEGPRPW